MPPKKKRRKEVALRNERENIIYVPSYLLPVYLIVYFSLSGDDYLTFTLTILYLTARSEVERKTLFRSWSLILNLFGE